ncbi:hypothetical protein K1T71_013269 [Dendrolimus kikuchii]|uniref:Uncharacterized protein n=1 Tax=Dendrolimus kikuchii TaxID=765133 RepID=A0ACC1CHR7_9NEOP|nr:hypothetical protein K1T71_013269 [Dendrolimus kikuchii]
MCSVGLISILIYIILSKYDVIVIPLKKEEPAIKKHVIEIKTQPIILSQFTNNDNFRLDIENYDEATNVPDIDGDDFGKNDNDVNDISKRQEYNDDNNYGDDKIVNGIEVDINLYPYHVGYGSNCGGAIIDRKWVVTAGHCGKKSYIRVGSKYLNLGRKVHVKQSYVHPNWAAKKKEHPFDFDFQLLELAEPLKFDANIQPVKVGHVEDMVVGKVITVTGWGNTEENGPYSNILRAVRVPIISKEKCQNVPFPYFRGSLTPRMFCAGYAQGRKDACQGDSGGPAVAYDRLLGMVSFGYGCATPGSYGVYSKVTKVRSWIEQVTKLMLE